jgi:hypothetical protein
MKFVSLMAFFAITCSSINADVLVVTSLDDSGAGTLRDALENVAESDFIEFDSALMGTITLASSLPTITADFVTLNGPSDGGITIEGGSLYQIFNVVGNTFTANNLTLSNGASVGLGGAIHLGNDIDTFISNMVIAPGSGSNAAKPVYLASGGVLHLNDTTFTSTSSANIYLDEGSIAITNNDSVQYMMDGVGGGAVYKYGSGSMNLTTPPAVSSDFFLAIVNGTITFNGAIVGPAYVFGGLQGEFSSDYIVNYGSLEPGTANTMAEINSTGTFIQSSPGDMKITIAASGGTDLITATGDIFITGGTLTVIPQSGTYLQGAKYTFMTCEGNVNGEFDSVSSGALDVQINYLSQSIEIEILNSTTL